MWSFARVVWSCLPDGLDPNDVFRWIVEPEIEKKGGWRAALCTDLDVEDLQCDFAHCWKRIRFGIGEGPLAVAHRNAVERPLELPDSDPWRDLDGYRTFVSLAYYLQDVQGDLAIFLPGRTIGPLLGRSHTRIMQYCAHAVEQGYLELVKKHSLVGRRAAEYRFDVSRFPVQEGDAHAYCQ